MSCSQISLNPLNKRELDAGSGRGVGECLVGSSGGCMKEAERCKKISGRGLKKKLKVSLCGGVWGDLGEEG